MNEERSDTWRDQLVERTAEPLPGTRLERITLFLLLLLALVLRFWGFPHIPYTHDEISALVRVDFPSLGEAIAKGVVNIDTHPPGTHAFLWMWTQLFGFSEGAVKLPFIVMSVVALFCLYRFTHAWTGGSVALITTALLATMQYTVMYGQIARPYAMGLFTTALLADQLTRYIGRSARSNLILAFLAALISAYTHHFALMLAALMVTTGLFLLTPSQRKAYLIAIAITVAAYLPNLPLFFAQLGWKGLDEWLTAPRADWTLNYLWWLGHCSVLFTGLLVALVLASLVLRYRHRGSIRPLWAIALVWGLLPLLVGYGYSVLRSPVLQYSVVLFSFPYLLIGILAGLRHLSARYAAPVAGLCAVVAVLTLLMDRRYFEVFYRSKYEAIVRGTQEARRTGALSIVDLPPEVLGFYRKLRGIDAADAPTVNLRYREPQVLDSALSATTARTVIYGQTTQAEPENVAKVQARFPFLLERHDMYEGQTFRFSATPQEVAIEDHHAERMKSPQVLEGAGWEVDAKIPLVVDTLGPRYGGVALERWDFTGHEYGAVYDGPLYELVKGPNDVIEVRADFASLDANSDISLVVELKEGDITRFYRAAQVGDAMRIDGSTALIASIKLADIPGHGSGLRVRTYLYNPSRKHALLSALGLRVREGDPVLYGIFEPITQPWRFP